MSVDRFLLCNNTSNPKFDDHNILYNPQVSETSACNNLTSAQSVPLFIASTNGHIADCFVAVAQTAVSASGFISGYINANVRINGNSCLTTLPSIVQAAASAANSRSRTNNSLSSMATTVSAVVNASSANFSAGDCISIDYGCLSAGSAAAGQPFAGIYIGVTARYYAS